MKRLIAVLSCGVMLMGLGPASAETPSEDMLSVCTDESTLEKQFRQFLKRTHDIDATLRFADDDGEDLVLVYKMSPGDAPEVRIFVDTLPSARSKEGEVTERCFKIFACYVLDDKYKTAEHRKTILELNNAFMSKSWMPHRIVLDKDGDILFENFVNIPSTNDPIPAAMVVDVLVRNLKAWEQYYSELSDALDM